jgi:hypothetical protein
MGRLDQYIVKYSGNGDLRWVRALTGSGAESGILTYSEDAQIFTTPVWLTFDPTTNQMLLSGDFDGTLALGGLTLNTGGRGRQGFVVSVGP